MVGTMTIFIWDIFYPGESGILVTLDGNGPVVYVRNIKVLCCSLMSCS